MPIAFHCRLETGSSNPAVKLLTAGLTKGFLASVCILAPLSHRLSQIPSVLLEPLRAIMLPREPRHATHCPHNSAQPQGAAYSKAFSMASSCRAVPSMFNEYLSFESLSSTSILSRVGLSFIAAHSDPLSPAIAHHHMPDSIVGRHSMPLSHSP